MGFFSVFLGILSLWIWIQSEAKEEKQKKGNDREANADAELTALSSFPLELGFHQNPNTCLGK